MRSNKLKPWMMWIAALATSLVVLASPSASAAQCLKSDPSSGLICGDDIPNYPNWRRFCAQGCILTTAEDERSAQRDRKLAGLVPRLRLTIDELRLERDVAMVQRDRSLEAYDVCASSLSALRAEDAARWSPWTWAALGAGSTLVAVLGGVLTLVLL